MRKKFKKCEATPHSPLTALFKCSSHKALSDSIYVIRAELLVGILKCDFLFSFFFLPNLIMHIIGKQFSLDSRMDLVFHGLDGGQSESGDKNHAITEDGEESWEGTKGRYCAMIIYRKI